MNEPRVGVVVLNFKVKEEVFKCLTSVLDSSYKNLNIVVVDNNSGDGIEGEISRFARNDGDLEFIQTGENLGYTGGNNVGIKKLIEDGCRYVFVINPDTEVTKDCIKILVEKMEEDEEIGVCGPKILFKDRKTIWFAGGVMDTNNVLGSHIGVDEKDLGQYNQSRECDYITGAALFLRTSVLKRIGVFDERFFLYYEDSDLCFRIKKSEKKIMYIPEAVVYHGNAKSTGMGSPLQDYFITRNRMLFAKKHLSFRTQFALFREALRNRGNKVRKMAFQDFLMNKFGKGSFVK